jgi:ankyrin repeat protein
MQKRIEEQSDQELRNYIEQAVQSTPESDKKVLIYVLKGKPLQDLLHSTPIQYHDVLRAASKLKLMNSILANELLGMLKISLSPAFTKHGKEYARNYYGLCHLLSLLWLRAHLSSSGSINPETQFTKSDFFAQTTVQFMSRLSSATPPTIAEKEEIISKLLQRLKDKGFLIPENWRGGHTATCENVIGMPLNEIYTIPFAFLPKHVAKITLSAVKNILIFISSKSLKHAMAMLIRVHSTYKSVVFYDPNSKYGDAKIALPIMMEDESTQIQRIKGLLSFSGLSFYAKPDSDFTLVCLNTNQTDFAQLKLNFLVQDGYYAQCLLSIVGAGNTGGYLVALQRLLHHPSMQNPSHINARDGYGATALYIAAEKGHTNVVRVLVTTPSIDLNAQIPNGQTSLCIASHHGHSEVVSILVVQLGIELNAKTQTGATALFIASQNGHAEVVRILVARPGIELNTKTQTGATALFIASQQGHAEVVRILVAQPGIELNAKTQNGATALYVASQSGHAQVVSILVAQPGIELNVKAQNGANALLIASQQGHAEVMSILVTQPGIELNEIVMRRWLAF